MVLNVLSALMARVDVIHSLPGRIRLHAPAIAHIPAEWSIADLEAIAARSIAGIRRVKASRHTATLLIEYDASLAEDEVVRFVRDALRLVVELAPRFTVLAPEARQRAMERLLAFLDSEGVRPGPTLTVPESVWSGGDRDDR